MLKFIKLASLIAACATELPTQLLADQGNDRAGSFRIAGGIIAVNGAYPFMVSLRQLPNEHFCGGSIITKVWVLTAAHCMFGETISRVKVVVGTNMLDSGGTAVWIQRVVMHPEFRNISEQPNDIALIRLVSALSYSSTVAKISIDIQNYQSATGVTTIGWGSSRRDGPPSNRLLQYSTHTVTQATCRRYWRGLTANQICTRLVTGNGICTGDSGGPLFHSSTKMQIGVVSLYSAHGCGRIFPDVYTRISTYAEWIHGIVGTED
ncbi:hypothetical protein Trydic_g12362 [Trypoxylus dichotomus]